MLRGELDNLWGEIDGIWGFIVAEHEHEHNHEHECARLKEYLFNL